MRHQLILSLLGLFLSVIVYPAQAIDEHLKTLRVGVLKFGTVNWTLDVIKHHQLDTKYGVNLEIVPLGSKNASHVALQGGGADMIVSDWIWVTRQRAENRDYTFVPYSNATGALMVRDDANIASLLDLKGKKLGVAGGPVDKSWLFLRAYALEKHSLELSELAELNFVAPPLLNKLAQRGDLDAALNFWHYTARLQASGFKSVLTVSEALKGLGIDTSIPVIGWVFSEQWAAENADAVNGFIAAAHEAQNLLLKDDMEWQRIRATMKAEDDLIFHHLRDAYREGVPACFAMNEKQAAKAAFSILAQLGGDKLIGNSDELSDGTFWKHYQAQGCTD